MRRSGGRSEWCELVVVDVCCGRSGAPEYAAKTSGVHIDYRPN